MPIYKEATEGARNCIRSKELPLGKWGTNINIINIPYAKKTKILWMKYSNTITKGNWEPLIDSVKRPLQDMCMRELFLYQRICHKRTYCRKCLIVQKFYV